jgi:hypothetical protein
MSERPGLPRTLLVRSCGRIADGVRNFGSFVRTLSAGTSAPLVRAIAKKEAAGIESVNVHATKKPTPGAPTIIVLSIHT